MIWPKIDDLRALRTTFLEKQLSYALSFEYESECTDIRPHVVHPGEESSMHFPARTLHVDKSHVFTVRGVTRVPGLDGLGHDVPSDFRIGTHQEDVFLRVSRDSKERLEVAGGSIASGRMVLVAPVGGDKKDGEVAKISVTYDGTLRLEDAIAMKQVEDLRKVGEHPLRAQAYVTPFFETTHPKYHWLTENACIAFGTWEFANNRVTASFDVYAAT
jgi:hypothetical protein